MNDAHVHRFSGATRVIVAWCPECDTSEVEVMREEIGRLREERDHSRDFARGLAEERDNYLETLELALAAMVRRFDETREVPAYYGPGSEWEHMQNAIDAARAVLGRENEAELDDKNWNLPHNNNN